MEESSWIEAAVKVLIHADQPMHYADIKRVILEMGLVPSDMKTTLEAALCKESQSPNKKVCLVEGKPGVFRLVNKELKEECVPLSNMAMIPSEISSHHQVHPVDGARYRQKYKKLQQLVKETVFLNAAYCDEVVRIEEKVARVKEERRYLLRRLLQHQAMDTSRQQMVPASQTHLPSQVSSQVPVTQAPAPRQSTQSIAQLLGEVEKRRKKTNRKKKPPAEESAHKGAADDVTSSILARTSKKSRPSAQPRRRITPVPLDSSGRPIFPIELGSLTVYSLGEIIPMPGYYTVDYIYPVGFCSTRLYFSISKTSQMCLYTCKVSDNGTAAKFEISPEDMAERTFTGLTPSDCHKQLLEAINELRGAGTVPMAADCGAEFFGLAHPTVQYLIQSCAGARKCVNYRGARFELSHAEADAYCEEDASVNALLFDRLPPAVTSIKTAPEPS